MFSNTFYSTNSIRKHTALFGTLFNNINIERDNDEPRTQFQKVPIAYGGREKYIARNTTDPAIEREIAAQLPRMAFELMDISYDPERQLNPVNNTISYNPTAKSRFVPVPYVLTYNLYITARYVEDAAKIVEQILPYFSPSFTIRAHLVDEDPDCVSSLLVTLRNVDMRDNYEGPMTERRILIWTLTFTINTWIYGPQSPLAVIRWATVNSRLYDSLGSNSYIFSGNSYPTLANTALSDIQPTDNYIVVTDISEFF